uniref:Uncharacterized protein n=1 Tax=Peronospora matthiolae TaxID=2874970 RepID=A0AAV1TKX5_9STRA
MTAPLCRNDSSSISCAEMTAPVRVPHVVHALPICAEMTAPVRVPHVVHSLPMSCNNTIQLSHQLCRNDSSSHAITPLDESESSAAP